VFHLVAFILALQWGSAAPIRIAIQPLSARSVKAHDAEMVADVLAGKLMESGRFRVMERSEMKRILAEQGFQKSGACDGQKCAVEVGRILGIEQMVVGAFGKFGTSWALTVRRVDVQSGEVVAQSSRQFEGPLSKVPDSLLTGAAVDLSKDLWGPAVAKVSDSKPSPVAPVEAVVPVPDNVPGPTVPTEIVSKSKVAVAIRVKADPGATATSIWLEEGQIRMKLGETPLDTSMMMDHRIFLVARDSSSTTEGQQYWLVGPEDSLDKEWKVVVPKKEYASGGGRWVPHGRVDTTKKRIGRGVSFTGLGLLAGGVLTAAIAADLRESKNPDGSLEYSAQDRENQGNVILTGVVASCAGIILAIIGANITHDAEQTVGVKDLRIEPVAAIGPGHANGLRLSGGF